MRRSLVLLIAAVLLLRGWAGEAVAGEMLRHELQSHAQAVVMQAHGADCQGTAVADGQDVDAADSESCAHCQACSLHALPAALPVLPSAVPLSHDERPAAAFASAEPLQGDKPPIA